MIKTDKLKESVKKLYLFCLQNHGIDETYFQSLLKNEQKLLHLDKALNRYYLTDAARDKITVVLTGGAFDVLHMGHIFTLEEAKKQGDVLIVAIAQDAQILRKGREPIHPQEYRAIIVNSLKTVDLAICGFDKIDKMLQLVNPDIIVYGYDQNPMQLPAPFNKIKTIKLEKKLDESKYKSGKIIEKLGL